MSYMTEANAIADALRGRGSQRAAPIARRGRGPGRAPTARNLAVLAFMREFFAANDQLPPVSAIVRHFGWTSQGAAQGHVEALRRFGLVESNAVGKLRFVRPREGAEA